MTIDNDRCLVYMPVPLKKFSAFPLEDRQIILLLLDVNLRFVGNGGFAFNSNSVVNRWWMVYATFIFLVHDQGYGRPND